MPHEGICCKPPLFFCSRRCSRASGQTSAIGRGDWLSVCRGDHRPVVLGLIGNPQSVAHISELGVVLLLFIIGLELSPRRLW